MVETLWVRVMDALRSRLSGKDFDSWIRPLRPRSWGGGTLTVEAASPFARDWLTRHLHEDIAAAVREVVGEAAAVVIEVNPTLPARPARRTTRRAPAEGRPSGAPPWHDRSFGNFVIGQSNAHAYRACRSVVEAPGARFNPLLIHGRFGVGKTHLLRATATALGEARIAVRFVTAEAFVNEMVHAVRNDGMARFRERYRGIEVLIVDDVQFLGGKQRSQEEFVHTFNALHDLGKQIVLASDRPPRELTELSAPLRSRIGAGMLAAIQPPDAAMCRALVERKIAERGLAVAPAVIDALAGHPWNNVREIEGAIVRLDAAASLRGVQPNETLVRELIGTPSVGRSGRAAGVERIMHAVCDEFGVSADDLRSRTRTGDVALARHVLMHLSRALTELSLKAIGHAVGGRDHSTVAHAVGRVERRLARDAALRERVRRLEAALSGCGGAEWTGAMDGTGGARGIR